jgi:membrane protease YdiL (CAAX protease family)
MSSIAPPAQPLPPPERPELPAGVDRSNSMPIATWGPLVAWLGGIGIFFAAGIIGSIPTFFSGDLQNPAPGFTSAGLVLQDSLLIAGVWLVVKSTNPLPNVQSVLGMRPTSILRAIGFMALIFFGYLVLSGIWDQIVSSPKEELLQDIGADNSVLAAIAIAFVVCVCAPIAEETLFRGFIFGGLRGWQGFWPAAIISGSMFGAAHVFGSPALFIVPLAVFGIGLALLYELTKSIFPGMYLHCLNNCLAFSVGLSLGWETAVVFVGSLSAVTLALMALRRVA